MQNRNLGTFNRIENMSLGRAKRGLMQLRHVIYNTWPVIIVAPHERRHYIFIRFWKKAILLAGSRLAPPKTSSSLGSFVSRDFLWCSYTSVTCFISTGLRRLWSYALLYSCCGICQRQWNIYRRYGIPLAQWYTQPFVSCLCSSLTGEPGRNQKSVIISR